MKQFNLFIFMIIILFSCQNDKNEISLINQEIIKLNSSRNTGESIIETVNLIKYNKDLLYCYDKNGTEIIVLKNIDGYLTGELKQAFSYHNTNGNNEWGEIVHQIKIKVNNGVNSK
jgi:hypothetical protein